MPIGTADHAGNLRKYLRAVSVAFMGLTSRDIIRRIQRTSMVFPKEGFRPQGTEMLSSVPVVFFPLVSNRAHNDVIANDLEQNDVARAPERNDQFARATVAQFCPTA